MCREHNILNTPLSPFLHKELLGHNHVNLDGSKLIATGFQYDYPALEVGQVAAMIQGYIAQGLFPPIIGAESSETKSEAKEESKSEAK
jgi:hypothetical protein